MRKQKNPVTIREKRLKDGRISLYLDIYRNGQRIYNFLGLYIHPENNRLTKERNNLAREQAERERAKAIIDIQDEQSEYFARIDKGRTKLCEYVFQFVQAKRGTICARMLQSYEYTGKILQEYNPTITLQEITPRFVRGFIAYLASVPKRNCTSDEKRGQLLSKTTQTNYYKKFVSILNYAQREGAIKVNPCNLLDGRETPKEEHKERTYLTLDEIQAINNIPDEELKPLYRAIKHAFLFACFTGLRFSDVKTLQWEDITTESNGAQYIRLTMQKTKHPVIIPLSENAINALPCKRPNGNGIVFYGLTNTSSNVNALEYFAKRTGIKKRVTFHVSRHTFATLLISNGVDIYTTSKLLGHTNVNTTQRYAHLIDGEREKAINKIPKIT